MFYREQEQKVARSSKCKQTRNRRNRCADNAAMTITSIQGAIVANFNNALPREELYRILLDHPEWYGGCGPEMHWLASGDPASLNLASRIGADLVGEPRSISHLDDYIIALPDDIVLLMIVPSDVISLGLERDQIADLKHFASGYRVERAIHARDGDRVRAYADFLVPYSAVPGKGDQIITLPTARGPMVPAFTTTDMAAHFIEAGSDGERAAVQFTHVDGEFLFGSVALFAKGVVVNFASAQAFAFDLDACRTVMGLR